MSGTPLQSLLDSGGAVAVDAAGAAAFLADPAPALLILTGDPGQRPEAEDVAVVARELRRQSAGRLRIGVVEAASEAALKQQLGVAVLPTVLFLLGGHVVARVERVADWAVYASAAAAILGPRARAKEEPQ